ncbi:MAG: hypothetical protein GX649_01185 [Chloroflexi bacterium]|nr:hypothetical protein [Chloroflexota bacterium]
MDTYQFALSMRTALYQCGQVARALQGQVTPENKAPDSPHQTSTEVSVVDRLCQEILLLRAQEVAPGVDVQSEELADCPPEILALFDRGPHRYALILDPLDGTGEYLAGGSRYGHMLGLLDQETGRMDCGMIYFPAAFRLYLGVRGRGAWVQDGLGGDLRPMPRCAPPRTVEDVKRLRPEDYGAFRRLGFGVVPPESASAAYELTRVAEGDLGAMAMRHFHGHDSAISSVIIEELGGLVVVEGGAPVRYDAGMPRMPLVVLSLDPEYAQGLAETLGA